MEDLYKKYEKALSEAERQAASIIGEGDAAFGKRQEIHDIDAAWEKVSGKIGRNRKRFVFPAFITATVAAAAAIALFIILPGRNTEEIIDIFPAEGAVTLKLADGKVLDLDSTQDSNILPTAVLDTESSTLDYSASTQQQETEVRINELTVAKGVTYTLVLSDGTTVHLNSGTSISFPESFTGTTRKVTLSGQAYFDVTPDAERPFIVETSLYNVTVVGTSFDVCAYPDERFCNTTLVTGKVAVDEMGNQTILQPSHQYRYDTVSHEANVREVDTSEITAWMDNELKMKKMPLPDILNTLQRKYEFTYELSPEAEKVIFSGKVSLDVPLSEILDILCAIHDLEWKIEGNKVIIEKTKA